MKRTPFLIVALATLPLILSACGGGSGSSATIPTAQTTETINGIAVPPVPNPTANNATLAGVDSNGNGVRDDVERKIASDASSQSQFNSQLLIAKEFQTILVSTSISNDDIKMSGKKIACIVISNKGEIKENSIRTMLLDSDVRRTDMRSKLSRAGGFAIEDGDCK